MQTTQLGSSDLQVSKICLGTMTFGEQNTEAEAHSQLDYALERGINFIDTAEMYPVMPRAETQGSTERYIGTWLKKSGKRKEIILATKAAGPSRGFGWIRNGDTDLTPANIRAAVETSLQRLQTDYIDLYQLHWPSRNAPIFGQKSFDPKLERPSAAIADTLGALNDLIKDGKLRQIGVSNETSWGVSEFIKEADKQSANRIVSIQNAYNLVNRGFEQGLDETCFRENVGLLAYSPLAFGQLTNKYNEDANATGRLTRFPATWSPRYMRPTVFEASRRYAELARANGMTPAQLALAWCYSRWFVASTIIGATNLTQLKENIDAFELRLSDEVITKINAIHAEMSNPGQ
ncbi:aldo/keto reductase [Undibacterium sp. RTI2.1]|uniref:aldo/keto reductase n=1 Tax=unclassified Undibacterium TaxID=2630295 RepID=UPI002AB46A53|nr:MULTISPECIES: aldo/keto reductase [unclassified Undibacterium]MDY7538643.1 aldo/keto reductase [Undibacterium sp. 5I1]MEB0030288.1 aldo/keto reductase [Undibacterium sp. RTI2.1]MEB0116912.1 aldo/keto reductase [Undibacterium sp. RTI2.2]MEB0232132.1 aldo/keto reductase [Undibacterium sp. 10I3]MEB0259446.1 aldo/keto reductase [Undibacterium sp. 5I1]